MRIAAFLKQPTRGYRNFQLVYGLIALTHLVVAVAAIYWPVELHEGFAGVNAAINGVRYYFPEDQGTYYRVIAATHLAGIAVMFALLQWNVRAHAPLLLPLVCFKLLAGVFWLVAFVERPIIAAALACATLDFVLAAVFVAFARPAYREASGEKAALVRPTLRRPMVPRVDD